jgi:capsular exopolysaccharide synthesis family protein
MSKLFEALNRGRGALPETVLAAIGADTPVPPPGPAAAQEPPPVEAAAPPPPAPDPVAAARVLPVRVSVDSPLLPFDNTDPNASEQYRIVRTRLIQHPAQPRLIVVTSAGAGDGKSVTAINLAGALSLKLEANVLLLDADFRRSSLHAQLGLPAGPGAAEVLKGDCPLSGALVHVQQFRNLYVLTAGAAGCNPAELLDASRWHPLCAALRAAFRYVIVDSPPLATVADYDLIQAACDGTLLVVRPDHTKRAACLSAIHAIPEHQRLGVLLNAVGKWGLGRPDPYGAYYYHQAGAGAVTQGIRE